MSSPKKRPTELVDMGKLMSMQGIDPLVLTQTSGPGHPRHVRVAPLGEVILGRDEHCGIVLDEEPVSRQHARILYADYQPELLDLGSMNGTFHNGKQVHRAFLATGDEIQVGTSVFRVKMTKTEPATDPEHQKELARVQSLVKSSPPAPTARGQSSAISGRLSEIRLMSLLQVIETDQSTGTLVVLHSGQEGKLYVHQGAVRHATFGRARGPKALYRMTALRDGRFDFYIPGRSPEYETIQGGLQSHLLEAMRQQDEVAVWRQRLPSPGARLTFNPQKHVVPAKVSPAVFEVMAAIGRHGTLGNVIELCQLPDSEICRVLSALLKYDVVRADAG